MTDMAQWRRECEKAKADSGPKKPYDDVECDHEYEEDEDALEFICQHCGDRQPMDLNDLLK